MQHISDYGFEIGTLQDQAEKLGIDGEVDEALELTGKADQLVAKRSELEVSYQWCKSMKNKIRI